MAHRNPPSMRSFYDRMGPLYSPIGLNTFYAIRRALRALDPGGDRWADDSFLEPCCGSGSGALALAGRCASWRGSDQSAAMLNLARSRWRRRFGHAPVPPLSLESVLDFREEPASVDWVLICFALHLFPPATELELLGRFLAAARKGVIVIDHDRRLRPFLAMVERIEGSWYVEYKGVDFEAVAAVLGVSLVDREVGGTRVMEFLKLPGMGPESVRRLQGRGF